MINVQIVESIEFHKLMIILLMNNIIYSRNKDEINYNYQNNKNYI
jgi:hypothetical protein